jgi:TPP-dependent pyruvate/acetoin dehydrogenase alpha subunit
MTDQMNAQTLIQFENTVKEQWENGELPFLLHLCGGNEQKLIDIFKRFKSGDWVFSSHRSHYHYLLAGGSAERLMGLIRNGRSMFVFDKNINFLTSSVLAGTCCMAAGVAWALKEEESENQVWCFLGDGAEEQGHFYEAVCFVQAHELPCHFIIEDNDRSVDTTKEQRKHYQMTWPDCVHRYNYTPTYPHAGSGCKHIIKFK